MEKLALALSVLAIAIAGITLVFAVRQLSVARDSIGGRALVVTWGTRFAPDEDSGSASEITVAKVWLTGPGKMHLVRFLIDGLDFKVPAVVVPELTVASGPVTVEIPGPEESIGHGSLVIVWNTARRDNVLEQAARFQIGRPGKVEVWHWKKALTLRAWMRRRGRQRQDPGLRPLGTWKPVLQLGVRRGEGPVPKGYDDDDFYS